MPYLSLQLFDQLHVMIWVTLPLMIPRGSLMAMATTATRATNQGKTAAMGLALKAVMRLDDPPVPCCDMMTCTPSTSMGLAANADEPFFLRREGASERDERVRGGQGLG